MLTTLALGAIRLSIRVAYKGFSLPYAAPAVASCSTLGYRAIRRFGVRKGITVLRWRLEECAVAYQQIRPSVPWRSAGSAADAMWRL